MLIRSITENAMVNKISIRDFPSPDNPFIAFKQKKPCILDIDRFITGEIQPQNRLMHHTVYQNTTCAQTNKRTTRPI